ncbi:MAG TPA: HAD family hydrolase, partial [Phycisphaerae bacterium]|nr:HAD family hydrolase [Phycisphaerae bacterium]
MPVIDALIFDLDDTLYPERAFAFSGFSAVAKAFADLLSGADQATARMRQLFDTEHRPRVFNTLLAEIGVEPDRQLITAMVQAYRTHRPTIALHADADAALTRLRGRCKLGLITDGPIIMQQHKIETLGL